MKQNEESEETGRLFENAEQFRDFGQAVMIKPQLKDFEGQLIPIFGEYQSNLTHQEFLLQKPSQQFLDENQFKSNDDHVYQFSLDFAQRTLIFLIWLPLSK